MAPKASRTRPELLREGRCLRGVLPPLEVLGRKAGLEESRCVMEEEESLLAISRPLREVGEGPVGDCEEDMPRPGMPNILRSLPARGAGRSLEAMLSLLLRRSA